MTWNFSTVISYTFAFFFFSFMAVHFAHMKTPSQYREIASHSSAAKHPWYDAGFKL
ncbi:MAG TPA: hypothetical protein VNJ08_15730 [Bacteriovoracaceae bacterium]|nr:hypothetical protein [Bacteriovoracaceae bacterium]